MAEETGGFLGRWARRKADARAGLPLQEPPAATAAPEPAASGAQALPAQPAAPASTGADPVQAPTPAPTLQDAQRLTPASDFRPFMSGNVTPDVRNAAMKKLFADPHYNVMDGLDIYIDDYSKADPIPEAMLRKMVGAEFLNLFSDEPPPPEPVLPRESADKRTDQSVPQSPALSADPTHDPHAHTHLRLQPDHAPAAPGSGRGTS